MKYGFVFPYGDARQAADLAVDLEQAGWDGFFVWEPVWGFDAWMLLAAAAMRTRRIRLGTMITPLARMRPWKLASETVTLDHLSDGRVTLAVGLGAVDTGWWEFGEETDLKTRAARLDEGLEILTGLWQGKGINFSGHHYRVQPLDFFPPPPTVQQPRIPIWVVGAWPRPRSMRRALRYDGLLPTVMDDAGGHRPLTLDDVRAIRQHIQDVRGQEAPYDIVVEGTTPGDRPAEAAAQVQAWEAAGATWWIEAMWEAMDADGLRRVQERVRQGPPRA
jgi:alkanesulfonate monooxygenase SsuD/methylene tetrahydromethanopterin reductase-like flavin-dependent oxidoreductase (luciferase family)